MPKQVICRVYYISSNYYSEYSQSNTPSKRVFEKKFLVFSQPDVALAVGWMFRLANSTLCVSESELFLDTNEVEPGNNILLIFSLKRSLIKAYTNGLTAELNMIMVCKMGNMKGLNSMLVVCWTMWRIESGSQVIPNMTLTLMTINVTRFRTFNTPCEKKKQKTVMRVYFGDFNSLFLRMWLIYVTECKVGNTAKGSFIWGQYFD